MRKRNAAFCGVMLIASVANGSLAQSPVLINQKIQKVGPGKAVRGLSDSEFDSVVKNIAQGKDYWLKTAIALRSGTDGARTEGIDLGLSQALRTNPSGVLRLIKGHRELNLHALCEDRAIEPSAGDVRAFKVSATKALRAVRDPSLIDMRDHCVRALNASSPAVQ